MNPDETLVKKIKNILQEDINKLQEIINQNLDRNALEEAFFLSQEIQMYLYKLFSLST
jgi:hypothetical protein